MLNTEREVKALVKGLRRELKALDKPAASLSHTQALELLARALGHPSYAALQTTLAPCAAADAGSAAKAPPAPPKYPLTNAGQFDFASRGEVRTGLFVPLRGTLETIPGTALVSYVERDAQNAGNLVPEYEGDTDVSWDGQETCLNKHGLALWETEEYEQASEDQLIVVPEGFDPDDKKLPVRHALVNAYLAYFREQGWSDGAIVAELKLALGPGAEQADTPLLDQAVETLGFALVRVECEALKRALAQR